MTEKKCTLNCCVHSSLPFVIIAGCSILCVWQNQCIVQTVFQGYCTSQTELVQSFRNIFTDTSSSWVLDFGNPVSCELRYEFPVYAALKTDTRRLLRSSTCFVPVSSIVGTFFATRLHDSWEPANCSYLSNMSLSKNKNSWESPGFWEVGRYHLCMSEPWLCQGTTLSLYLGIVRGALISRLPLRTKPLVKAEPCRCWAALRCSSCSCTHPTSKMSEVEPDHAYSVLSPRRGMVSSSGWWKGALNAESLKTLLPVCLIEEWEKENFSYCLNAWRIPEFIFKKVV